MTSPMPAPRPAPMPHGGPDGGPPIRFDFSTNANPYGPPPVLWSAVKHADRQRYPDPSYGRLRERLADLHGVSPAQIEPTAGGAEAIRRLTLAAQLHGLTEVWVPQPGFGDYAAAAQALGLPVRRYDSIERLLPEGRALVWVCDPCNPSGTALTRDEWHGVAQAVARTGSLLAVDEAYDALRLDGHAQMPPVLAGIAWRLQCPNKALGLTGIRAAYLVAPRRPAYPRITHAVSQLAPSWVLSAEGLAMLMHWHEAPTRAHLDACRAHLRQDRQTLRAALQSLSWYQHRTLTPFWLACPPPSTEVPQMLAMLREHGIKLRDATSFGLPGWVRVAAQRTDALEALLAALKGRAS